MGEKEKVIVGSAIALVGVILLAKKAGAAPSPPAPPPEGRQPIDIVWQ